MRKVTEDYIGTCQACFGEFKVGADKMMVLHGYKRPGSGYAEGECVGTNELPFEYDHALTDRIIVAHRERVARQEKYLDGLNAGLVTKLTRRFQVYDEATRRHVSKSEEIVPGDVNWKRTKEIEIANVESDIRFVTAVANHLQAAVDAWTKKPIVGFELPLTGKERGLRKAYDPVEEAAQIERDAIKAARDAKPGKLKIIFYRPHAERPSYLGLTTLAEERARSAFWDQKDAESKAWAAEIKAWAKTTFTEGKIRVAAEIGDYDLPSAIRRSGDFEVVSVMIDWSYLDRISELVEVTVPYEIDKKKRSFTVRRERKEA